MSNNLPAERKQVGLVVALCEVYEDFARGLPEARIAALITTRARRKGITLADSAIAALVHDHFINA